MVTMRAGDGAATATRRGPRRQLAAAVVGGTVESFDWTIYGVLAPYFADQIFPGTDVVARLAAAYLGFAVGFLARPVGGVLLGRLADRRGRRFTLTLSVLAIAAGALVLAVLPGQSTIGTLAPVAFVLVRLLQGLSAGGEAPTVAAYVAEIAPSRRRYLYSALSYGGLITGSLLAFVVLAVLVGAIGGDGLRAGGWRIGFVIAAVLGLVAFWIRWYAPESAAFTEQADRDHPQPALRSLVAYRRQLIAVFLVTVGGTVGFYFGTLYLPVYASQLGVISMEKASAQIPLAFVALIVLMVVFGTVADRMGGLRLLRIAVVVQCLVTVPLMAALASGAVPFLATAVGYTAVFAPGLAIGYVLGARLFPVAIRSTGFGAPGAVAGAIFGGTFPLVAQSFAHAGRLWVVPWYAAACAGLGLVGVLLIKERDLIHRDEAPSAGEVAEAAPSPAVSG